MTILNRLLALSLLTALIATGCVAASLTEVHGSISVSFGKQPKEDPRLAVWAAAIPASVLNGGK